MVLRAVAPQLVASIRTTLGGDEEVGPLFVEVESHVIAAEARANGPPLLLYHHYTKGDIEVAVPLSHPVAGGGDIRVYRLSGSPTMATTIHMGGYHSIDDASWPFCSMSSNRKDTPTARFERCICGSRPRTICAYRLRT